MPTDTMKLIQLLLSLICLNSSPSCVFGESHEYISNNNIKLGVDLSKGGSIFYLSAASNDINIVNTYDEGRYIQQSYYGGPTGYEDCVWRDNVWSWNPIAAGDAYRNEASIISFKNPTSTSMHIVSIPLQWACDNIPCNCIFEQYIELNGRRADVTAILHNNRDDQTLYDARTQELPAVYTTGILDTLVSYSGSSPWTDDDNLYIDYNTGFDNSASFPWIPGK